MTQPMSQQVQNTQHSQPIITRLTLSDKCKRQNNQKQQIQLSKKTTNIGKLTKANDTKASFKARKQTRSIRQLLGTHNAILSWNSVAGTLYIIKLASLHL